MPPRSDPLGQQRGVVLVVVLWLLVAMAVAAGMILLWSRERVADAQTARLGIEERIALIGARDTLLYLGARVPMTLGGQPLEPIPPGELALRRLDEFGAFDKAPRGGELRLDDAPYLVPGGIVFRLQDEAGLVPIALPVNAPLVPWLRAAGVPRRDHAGLADALGDYTDADRLRRLHGAEAREYERDGRPPPPDRPLLAVAELSQVAGFERLPAESLQALMATATTLESGALNLNTAPVALLEAVVDRCDPRCRQAIAARAAQPFLSGSDFEARTGARLPGDRDVDFRTAPSQTLRLTLGGHSGRAWRLHVRWTPLADREAPWRIDAVDLVPRPVADEPPTPIEHPLFAAPPLAGP